jgi:putative SOS response-associated peptidase YedK
MCSRFELNHPAREVAVRFGLALPPNLPPPVVRPTDLALVITAEGAKLARFGLAVSWSKQPLINARAETVAGKPSFRPLLGRRCLVPASLWVEWPGKVLTRLRPADHRIFALAGLLGEDGFVLLTCTPAPAIAALHDRMPVVLAETAEAAWIDPARTFAEVEGALTPTAEVLEIENDRAPGLFD